MVTMTVLRMTTDRRRCFRIANMIVLRKSGFTQPTIMTAGISFGRMPFPHSLIQTHGAMSATTAHVIPRIGAAFGFEPAPVAAMRKKLATYSNIPNRRILHCRVIEFGLAPIEILSVRQKESLTNN